MAKDVTLVAAEKARHSELAVQPTMAQPLPPAQHATNLSLQGKASADHLCLQLHVRTSRPPYTGWGSVVLFHMC